MSSDQHYPYPPQPGPQGQGEPYDPAADPYPGQQRSEQPRPYGDEAHQQQYHQPQSYAQQPLSQPYAPQQPPQSPAYGQPQPYPPAQPYAQAAPGHQDPSAQTWEGETWDTTYQPVVPPHTMSAAPSPAAAETAYLPPVRDHHPGPAPAAAETAYLPPVRDTHQAAPHSAGSPLPPESRATAPRAPGGRTSPVPPATQGTPGDGYSTPTTAGNARITDAQRARAEGRSPIIAPGIQPAALTAGLGLLLAIGAALGSYALLLPLVVLQAVTAAGWFRLNGMWPARQGIALAFAGGLAADGVLLWAGRENAPAAILGTLGVWVLLTLVLQLRSHAGADERMYGLMATVASAALTILAAGYFAASDDAVTVGGTAVAVAAVVRALPLPGPASIVASLLAAGGAGAVVGGLTELGSGGALLGVVAGVMALVGLRVASYDYPSRFVHFTAGVALPLTAAAPAVYLIGRVLA